MTAEQNEIIPRILRDMNDGVLVVDMHGKIIYINDKGCGMLGVDGSVFGKNYSRVFLENEANEINDGFHQFVLDAIYDKENTHTGEVFHQAKNQELKSFRLISSFLYGEDGIKKNRHSSGLFGYYRGGKIEQAAQGSFHGVFCVDDLRVRLSVSMESSALSWNRAARACYESDD